MITENNVKVLRTHIGKMQADIKYYQSRIAIERDEAEIDYCNRRLAERTIEYSAFNNIYEFIISSLADIVP